MARKPFKYNELTDKVCSHPSCNKKLKKNLLAKNPNADLCYKHWVMETVTPERQNGKLHIHMSTN